MKRQREKSYQIKWKKSAVKSAKNFSKDVRESIVKTVEKLSENPFSGKLLSGELKGLRRIRIGNLRVIYLLNKKELIILIVKIGNRGDIYK